MTNPNDHDAPYRVTVRDRIAYHLAAAAMRIASPQYRAFVREASYRGAEGLIAEAIADAAHDGHGSDG